MESVRVTLTMGYMEPDQSIFCNQARPQVVELGHQPTHKTYSRPAWYVFWDQHLAESSLKKPERLYSANAESPSQTLGGRWGVLPRWRKDLRNQSGQQYPKITAHRTNQLGLLGTQRDQGSCRDLPWVFCIYVMMELLSILVGFQTVGV